MDALNCLLGFFISPLWYNFFLMFSVFLIICFFWGLLNCDFPHVTLNKAFRQPHFSFSVPSVDFYPQSPVSLLQEHQLSFKNPSETSRASEAFQSLLSGRQKTQCAETFPTVLLQNPIAIMIPTPLLTVLPLPLLQVSKSPSASPALLAGGRQTDPCSGLRCNPVTGNRKLWHITEVIIRRQELWHCISRDPSGHE